MPIPCFPTTGEETDGQAEAQRRELKHHFSSLGKLITYFWISNDFAFQNIKLQTKILCNSNTPLWINQATNADVYSSNACLILLLLLF